MKRLALLLIGAFIMAGAASPAVSAEPKGKEVFELYCSHCHGSREAPGTTQLSRTRGAEKGLLTERTDLAPQYIEFIVRHGLKSMPAFVPSDLDAAKLEALIVFLTKQEAGKKQPARN